MKVVFLCAYAHTTIIEKPEDLFGRMPEQIQCSHLNCGCPSMMFPFQMDPEIQATHIFYNIPKLGEIVTAEEQRFLDAGGLMFREIPENVPDEVKKEFVATEGITKLATFIIKAFPEEQRLPDIIDTAISLLNKFRGHLSLMKTLKGKTPGGKDLN